MRRSGRRLWTRPLLYVGLSCLALANTAWTGSVAVASPALVDAGVAGQGAGYLVTRFQMVKPGAGPGDCPDGFAQGYSQRFLAGLPPGERKAYEENPGRIQAALAPWYYDDPAEDPCATPQAFPDPGMPTIEQPLTMPRLASDGTLSLREAPPARCPSADDFAAQAASRTIDNQYWRVMGCVRGYQPAGLAEAFGDSAILDGSMTILLSVEPRAGDIEGAVDVGIYSSQQPVAIGTNGKPLPFLSLPVTDQTRYHNTAAGKLRDGVMTTELFDLRIIQAAQRLDSELILRDARLRLEVDADTGTASGYLAGYWDLGSLAHAAIRIQDRTGLSSGKAAADAHGYTCPAKYHAVQRLADGHPDPETGKCTSISVLYRFEAVPAFVLAANTPAVTP